MCLDLRHYVFDVLINAITLGSICTSILKILQNHLFDFFLIKSFLLSVTLQLTSSFCNP